MSEIRYFKKFNPQQTLFLSTGQTVKFTPVDHDWGVIAVNNPLVISEVEAMMREQRGGISEITAEEYTEQKKTASERLSAPKWREEIGKNQPRPIPQPATPHAVPAASVTVPEVAVGDVSAVRPKASR